MRNYNYTSRRSSGNALYVLAAVLIVGAIVGMLGMKTIGHAAVDKLYSGTVVNAQSVARGQSGHEYRVSTRNEHGDIETFTVSDSFLYGNFRSADTFAEFEKGAKCKFRASGFRNGWPTMMPNIHRVVNCTMPTE